MIVRWSTAAGIVVSAAFVGLVAWVMGLKGLANMGESSCFADLDNHLEYGAYEMSSELWLPSFECRLRGDSVEPIVVQHPIEAFVAFGWVVMVPVVYAIAVLAYTLRWARRDESQSRW